MKTILKEHGGITYYLPKERIQLRFEGIDTVEKIVDLYEDLKKVSKPYIVRFNSMHYATIDFSIHSEEDIDLLHKRLIERYGVYKTPDGYYYEPIKSKFIFGELSNMNEKLNEFCNEEKPNEVINTKLYIVNKEKDYVCVLVFYRAYPPTDEY